jgi:PAS domain S-box-containing protein
MNPRSNDKGADLATEQLRIFRHAATLLASSLDFEQTLANTVSACLPALGDFGFFDVVVEDGVRCAARAHLDPETEAILLSAQWVRQGRTDMNLCALSTGNPGLHNDIDDVWYRKVAANADHLAVLRKLAFRSMLTVPMRYGEELIGSLTLFMGRSGRNHSAADLEFAKELVALAAPVVVNVRLLEKQRQAEFALRISEERLRLLDSMSQATRAAIDPKSIMDVITRLLGEHLAVTRCAYADLEPDNDRFTIRHDWTAEGAISTVGEYSLDLFGPRAVADMREGRTLLIRDVDRELAPSEGADMFNAIGIKAVICCPLVKEGRLLAMMAVHQDTPRTWTAADVALVEEVVERCWAHIERVRATEALRKSEAHLSSIIEQTAAGIAESDLSGRLTGANGRFCQILGRSRDTLLGQNVRDITHPDDLARNLPLLDNAVKNGTPFDIEKRYLRQDGSSVWASTTVSPIRTAYDKPADKLLAVVLDITERRRAEEKLRETADRLQFTLEAAEIGDWDLDLINDTSFRSLRHDRCFGYTEPIADWGFEKFIHHVYPDDREFVARQFQTALAELKDWHFECRVVWPDQSIHWIAAHGSIYHIDTRPARMGGIVFDITERKQAEEELRKADRRKDEFLAMLAHELRNPLAPISAAAELMELAQLDEARLRQTSQVIARQVRHMTGLVDDLLDVSRVTRGLVTIDKSPQDVKNIVSNAVEQVRPLVEARRHHLVLQLAPERAHVSGDPKRLVQILTNLLNNAAKYTPEGGNIELRMEVDDGQVMLDVLDDGIGIAPELQARVFDLFAQAERSSARSQGGLGLGLALVKSLVELHGGKVSCFSEGLGKGSRFTVCLPRVMEQMDLPERRQGNRNIDIAATKLRILVVDDNADAAEMLAMFLEASGHHVLVEHEPRQALERARMDTPDVCLIDIGLPDMDGNELARLLRAQPATSDAVLIAVTGYGQEHDRQNSLAAGFSHHLVKPVDTAKLVALLAEIGKS